MTQPESINEVLNVVEFQLSLLHISRPGIDTPQAEELASLLRRQLDQTASPS